MKWVVHPAKRDLTKTILSATFIMAFLVFVSVFYGLFWGIFGLVVLLFSLHSYYFPTSYELTEDLVIIKNVFMTQKRKLTEFRKVYTGSNGVLLSPFRRKTYLNQFRGVFLLLPEQRNEILEFLTVHIEKKDDEITGHEGNQ